MKSCRIILPPTPDVCGKLATHILVFSDGDAASSCEECALRMQEIARTHGRQLKVEKIK